MRRWFRGSQGGGMAIGGKPTTRKNSAYGPQSDKQPCDHHETFNQTIYKTPNRGACSDFCCSAARPCYRSHTAPLHVYGIANAKSPQPFGGGLRVLQGYLPSERFLLFYRRATAAKAGVLSRVPVIGGAVAHITRPEECRRHHTSNHCSYTQLNSDLFDFLSER